MQRELNTLLALIVNKLKNVGIRNTEWNGKTKRSYATMFPVE